MVSGAWAETVLKVALLLYASYCITRALFEQSEPIYKPGRSQATPP